MIVGIDVGLSGAIAVLRDGKWIACYDMPIRERGKIREVDASALRDIFCKRIGRTNITCVGIEDAVVHRQGVNEGRVQVARYQQSFAVVYATVELLGLSFRIIPPNVWKPALVGVGKSKQDTCDVARTLMDDARVFLRRKSDHNRADAALVAWYLEKYTLRKE